VIAEYIGDREVIGGAENVPGICGAGGGVYITARGVEDLRGAGI
jgi:hypothetical protein